MTLRDIALSMYEIVRGEIKDGDDIDMRLLYNFIHTARMDWISKSLNNSHANLEPFEQDFGAIEVEVVDTASYANLGISTDVNVLQSIKNFPKFMYKNNNPLITRVGPIDKYEIKYELVNKDTTPFIGNGKFNATSIFSFSEFPKIKIQSKASYIGLLKYINVRGIIEDPTLARGFQLYDGSGCYTPDTDYPISGNLINYLQGDIIKHKLARLLNLPSDRVGDGALSLETNEVK